MKMIIADLQGAGESSVILICSQCSSTAGGHHIRELRKFLRTFRERDIKYSTDTLKL